MSEEDFLKFAFIALKDEIFLKVLEEHRGRGRNDYPIELLWNGLLACVSNKVSSVEEMRRKMKDWPDLFPKVPTSFSFSRFFTFLCRFSSEIESLLFRKIEKMNSDFGRVIAIGSFDQIHFLFEPRVGLPLIFQLASPNQSNLDIADQLINRFSSLNGNFASRVKYLLANSSYDGLIKIAWDRYQMRALVPLAKPTQAYYQYRDAQYDEQGMVYCSVQGQKRAMIYAGFEQKRNTLKYRCMAQHYGTDCENLASCSLRRGIRIPISLDDRIFSSLPRASYRWSQIFSHYSTCDVVSKNVQSYLQFANNDLKKMLYCRVASLLLLVSHELKKFEKCSCNG